MAVIHYHQLKFTLSTSSKPIRSKVIKTIGYLIRRCDMDFKVKTEIKLDHQIFDSRFHPCSESNLIAAATIAGDVHLFESGSEKSCLRRHHRGSPIRKVRFTRDGRLVTIAKTVKVHDLTSGSTTHTLRRNDGKSTSFYSVMPFTSNVISAGDDDGAVFVWDTRTSDAPVFSSFDCEQYISDIDGKFEARRLMVCTSGEGTLTAYDLRAKRMIEPQSELFEAGFQCVKLVDSNKKVVIGGEDGAVYVFNQNEWSHTSGKYAISSDLRNRGKCSIDSIDKLPDTDIFLAGCSDGKMRSLTLWPHNIIGEISLCKKSPIESLHVSPVEGQNQIVVSGENYINIVEFEDASDKESAGADTSTSPVDGVAESKYDDNKKKPEPDDYLNVFQ